jgi:RimJ/RimL family protein N-acetyltransferase
MAVAMALGRRRMKAVGAPGSGCFNAGMIETARLTLRPPKLEDFEPIHAMRSDPEVVRFVGGKTLSREEAWHRLMRSAGHWSLLGYGLFVVVERASGAMVGEVGLMRGERSLGETFDPFPEAAWILARDHHGKGYATEAAQAAHDWFDRTQGARRTVCIINPQNAGSLQVAHKLGYRSFGTTCYHDDDLTMLERPAG